MFLDDDDLIALTGKTRRDAQARALDFMGVGYKLRPDGSVVVMRASVEHCFGFGLVSKKTRKPELCLDAIK